MDWTAALTEMGRQAKAAARQLAVMPASAKNAILLAVADELQAREPELLAANARDLEGARGRGLNAAMLDRLRLNPLRIRELAKAVREVAALPDPVGKVDYERQLPTGLLLKKVRVPIGPIGIIYESRPNVTVESAVLCLKTGNPVLLRGGSEALHSNLALAEAMAAGGARAGLPAGAVQVVPWTDREAVKAMLRLKDYLSLVIPRGGESLIEFVVENATVPVIKHYKGVCHIFVDRAANPEMALDIIENAKCQRPGTCNAVEKVLLHRAIAASFAPLMTQRLRGRKVELRGDAAFLKLVPDAIPATPADWDTEYLDLILTVAVVDSLDAAMDHIATHGSAHSDAIISEDAAACARFLAEVDSAAVYANASTRFTDGGQFGMGAEIGISTDRIHARGPMGLEELTSYKFVVIGQGQVRQ